MDKNSWGCRICGCILYTFDDCEEIWVNGSRIDICKNPECKKIFIQGQRKQIKIKAIKEGD